MIQCFIMEDQQIRETVRKSISYLYYGKSGDILQEEKYFFIKLQTWIIKKIRWSHHKSCEPQKTMLKYADRVEMTEKTVRERF